MKMNGGQALMRSLERQGVEIVFGLPGGAILPAYDPLIDSTIRHVLVRHEQGAGHMAQGYAQATGQPGVAMVTSGPGATNIVTPLCDAYMDSIPLVVITGQVPYAAIGTDAFQECDTTGITMSVTKHNFLVSSADELPQIIHDAFHIATTGRPGPVLVDVPKCIVDPRKPALGAGVVRARRPRPAGLQAAHRARRRSGGRRRRADPRGAPAGHLLRRGDPQGTGGRRPAALRRTRAGPGGHDPHEPGRVPRRPPAVPGHARHARATTPP